MSFRKVRKAAAPYALLIPATLLILVFLAGLANGIMQSFGIVPYLGMTDFTTEYFAEAFQDERILKAIGYSLYLAVLCTAFPVVGAIALSAALTRLNAGNNMKLFAINLPLSVAHIVVAALIIVMFGSSGMIARVLFALGFIPDSNSFPSVIGAQSGWGIVLVFMFKEIPYIALCTLAIMMNIGKKYSEAALVLGASPLRTFFSITLPLCKTAIMRAALVVFAFAFGSYEIPFLLAPSRQATVALLAFYEFQSNDIANRCYAMTIIALMIAITLVIAVAYFILTNREKKELQDA